MAKLTQLDPAISPQSQRVYGRKSEEYHADFELTARRVLNEDDFRLFRLHYISGAAWGLCVQVLGIDRARFFRDAYRIQERLGKAFAEIEPYALYPVQGYFSGSRMAPRAAIARAAH